MSVPARFDPVLTRREPGLIAALLTDLGGVLAFAPFGDTPRNPSTHAPEGWELAAAILLAVAVLGLAVCWLAHQARGWVEWAVRLGAGAWLALGFATAIGSTLPGPQRWGLGLILVGLGGFHLHIARRIEVTP